MYCPPSDVQVKCSYVDTPKHRRVYALYGAVICSSERNCCCYGLLMTDKLYSYMSFMPCTSATGLLISSLFASCCHNV